MKINNFFKLFSFLVIGLASLAACQSSASTDTPTEAYKRLFDAVKKKDVEAIKQNMSKTTNDEFVQTVSAMQNKQPNDLYSNGFTETTMRDALPPMRNERVKENMGALEVQNPKGTWEDLPFVLENGRWKLAIGDIFKGTYKQPAPAISQTEANKNVPQIVPAPGAEQMNVPVNKNPLSGNSAPTNSSSNANKNPDLKQNNKP
jgi:hypothetical protein